MKNQLIVRSLIMLALGILSAQCATTSVTGRQQTMLIDPKSLFPGSFDEYHKVIESSHLSQDEDLVNVTREISQNLIDAAYLYYKKNGRETDLKGYEWEVNVINAPEIVNATCMPGGKIVVYTGILPVTGGPDGLAAILGHEIAHALANHSAERVSQMVLAELGNVAVEAATEKTDAEVRESLRALYGLSAQYGLILPFSRKHESEADKIGLYLMALAGYDVNEAPKIWQRMSELGGEQPAEFVSTHPSHERRYNDLMAEIPGALAFAEQYKVGADIDQSKMAQQTTVQPAGNLPAAGTASFTPQGTGNSGKTATLTNSQTNKGTAGKAPSATVPPVMTDSKLVFQYKGKGTADYDKHEFESTAPKLEGTYYRIQLEYTSKALLDLNKYDAYKEFGEIYVEQMLDNPSYRILVGMYKTLDAAKTARNKARDKGMPKSTVIEFKNGDRGNWYQL